MPNLHALLIGIDYYQPNRLFRNLKGAVRDILFVETFLQENLKLSPESIRKLLATNPEDSTLAEVRAAAQVQEPTYANIVKAFEEITAIAQPHDQVYIHYSGHGAQVGTIYPELKGEGQYDEGIVPMDLGTEERYLRDVELATLLKRMTDKGLVVTVVFDCCNSGGATRGDCEIRGAEMPDRTLGPQDSLVADRASLMQTWQSLTTNTPVHGVLPDSREYVFLAACRPSEFAYEYDVTGGGERHGALTYWMVDTLRNQSMGLTYRSLYNRINAKIQSRFLQRQLPMLLGDSQRQVFGLDQLSGQSAVTVLEVNPRTNQVTLSAGLAQGLSRGARFAVYPRDPTDFSDRNQVAVVELAIVRASDSLAQLVTPEAGGIGKPLTEIESGAPAVMLSAPIDLVRRVRLFDQKVVGTGEADLPEKFVASQATALDRIRQATQRNGWVHELAPDDSREAHYQVAVGRDGTYEICAMGRPIENLRPPLGIDEPEAAQGVVQRLVHLAKYEAIRALENPQSHLANFLDVELLTQPGWQPGMAIAGVPFADPSNIVVQAGDYVFLRIKNRYQNPLNIVILDLEPTWEISQIPLMGFAAMYYSFQAQEEKMIELRLQLPAIAGYESAIETIKVFGTLGSADFEWLTLPALDQVILPRSATRSLGSPLSNLLEAIGGDIANQPTLTRAAVRVPDPNQEWVTKQIQITVKSGESA